ncbi:MAG TPA: LPS assembly protein LptD, partial [Candidatus Kryptonia bacterium]|nr:LPS assembly protein LptD [Candidatus Kryptonia bacterium]
GLGQSYHIENGRFTTCDCGDEAPSWSVAGKEIDVALSGYGRVRDGTFNVLDVPVFYIPNAVFPVNQERQSGLLMPRFSVSNRRGFQILAPAYWAIDRSQDLTIAGDVETGARVGLVGEYRYALSRDFQGEIAATYFNEFFRGTTVENGQTVPTNRWSVVTEHTNAIGSATAYADLFLVSDDAFLREINTFTFDRVRDTKIRTQPFTESRFGLLNTWDRVALRVQGTYYQDLVNDVAPPTGSGLTTTSDKITLQRLPDAELWGQWLFGQHLLARADSSVTNFQRSEGIDGFRIDAAPEAIVPFQLGSAVFGSVHAGLRETGYTLTETDMSGGFRGDIAGTDQSPPPLISLPRDSHREIFSVTTEAGTAFSRVYDFDHFGITKLKHTIEPLVEYTYVPRVNQDDEPVFDGLDRDRERSLFTYGFASRLLAKSAAAAPDDASANDETPTSPSIRELARLSLTQSVDTERIIPPVGQTLGTDHFSDVDLALRVQPSNVLALRATGGYNVGASEITSASVGFRFRDPDSDEDDSKHISTRNSLAVTYRFITGSLLQQVDSALQLRITDRLGFVYADRVDILENRFLENYFGLRLLSQCDCWGIDFAVVDKSNPQEVEVRAQITLVGLGSTGHGQPSDNRGPL